MIDAQQELGIFYIRDMAKKEVSYHKHKDSTKYTRRLIGGLVLLYILLYVLKIFDVIAVYNYESIKIAQQRKVIEVQQEKIKALQIELQQYR